MTPVYAALLGAAVSALATWAILRLRSQRAVHRRSFWSDGKRRLPLAPRPIPRSARFDYVRPIYLLAHRGLASYATENTAPAIALAAQSGANGIEIDVSYTRDRVPVLVHDSVLLRLAGRSARVSDLTLEQLRRVPILPANRILTLQEFLANFAHSFEEILLDLKHFRKGPACMEDVAVLADSIRSHAAQDKVVVDTRRVEYARAAARLSLRASLRSPTMTLCEVRQLGIRQISLDWSKSRSVHQLEVFAEAGMDVCLATVNQPQEIPGLFARGAHAVVTDAVEDALDQLVAAGYVVPRAGAAGNRVSQQPQGGPEQRAVA